MRLTRFGTVLYVALALFGVAFAADRIELTDGSIIFGKLLSVEGGKFTIETAFAGKLQIEQSKVKGFSTDEPVNIDRAVGLPVFGRVEATPGGNRVLMDGQEISVPTGQVMAVWRRNGESPEVRKINAAAAARARKWSYEASAAIAGRTGVAEKFGADLGFKATLANDTDKLVLTYAAQRATDNGVETANREFGSVDYSSFYTPDNGWYVRTSLEQDRIKLLDLRSGSSVGFARKLAKNARTDLELRAGVDYVYEKYSNDTRFNSPGLDIALLYTYQMPKAKFTDTLVYTPAFKDFSNYRLHHEAAFEVPLAASMWKLKLGLANDYNSIPPDDVARLDTTYFTSLLLNWK